MNSSFLLTDLDKWARKMTPSQRKSWQLRKGRAYRRCEDMEHRLFWTNASSREFTLYDLLDWQVHEFNTSMNYRLTKRKKSILARIVKKGDLLESLYTLGERIGFSSVVLYFGTTISLGNYNMLEKRLFSLCSTTSTLVNHLGMDGMHDDCVRDYSELVNQGLKEREKNSSKEYVASLSECPDAGLEVELQAVSFVYPTRCPDDPDHQDIDDITKAENPRQFALQNFSFKFERGKTYAIVGQNGAGKTTLVQLLACLFTPTSGVITINGENILDYDPKEVRAHISVLFQDFYPFSFLSARETIEIGDVHNPDRHTKAERIANDFGVTQFVPLDTVLHDIATQAKDPDETWRSDLSGGQWQKIGLARSFMRDDVDLLILDEPTSALDVEAEHEFFKQIRQRRRGKTTIFITHKFNTTKSADCILFLKEGRVWESGSFSELLELDGEYARLYKLQTEGYNQLK